MLRFFGAPGAPCLVLTFSLAGAGLAQTPDPQDARAAVPPLKYESPLAIYRAYADQDVAPWRESNDTVGRIGGWKAYAREADPSGDASPPPRALDKAPVSPQRGPQSGNAHSDHHQ